MNTFTTPSFDLLREIVLRPFSTRTIEKVIFNDPAIIVFWDDGTKTVVKCQKGDTFNKETGLALCCAKKLLGNKGSFNKEFKKWIKEEN